jgi:mycoredoxin
MTDSDIIVCYGTDWCPDCHRARRFFAEHHIPYQWVNIDRDPQAEDFVKKVNNGCRSVPTIVWPDGSILVEPSRMALERKMEQEN